MPLEEPLVPAPLVLAPPVLVPPPAPVAPEVLEPLEVLPALEGDAPSSFRHFSFSAPVSASQRADPEAALLLVEGELLLVEGELLEVLGVVAEGLLDELEPADGLELEPLEDWPNDAADMANSAAAVAVTRIFNVMVGFSCVRVKEKRKDAAIGQQAACRSTRCAAARAGAAGSAARRAAARSRARAGGSRSDRGFAGGEFSRLEQAAPARCAAHAIASGRIERLALRLRLFDARRDGP